MLYLFRKAEVARDQRAYTWLAMVAPPVSCPPHFPWQDLCTSNEEDHYSAKLWDLASN